MRVKVFSPGRDAGDICGIIIPRTAGGVSFQSEGPTTAKAWCWGKPVRDLGPRRSNRSAERSGREVLAESSLRIRP